MSHLPRSRALPQEVIEIIFSYLSQSTLRCCVRLVCKEWNIICLKYALWRAGVWSADFEKQRVSRLLKQLRRLDSLAIWVRCDPTLTDHRQLVLNAEEENEHILAFEAFRDGILEQLGRSRLQQSGGRDVGTQNSCFGSLADRRRVLRLHPFGNLKELSLHGYGIDHGLYTGPLLPAMGHLQRLKLELWTRQDVFLLRLLRACPMLEDLEIFGRLNEGLRIWVEEDDEEERSSVRPSLSHHSLKRLYLRRVSIRQGSLVRLISILSELIAFRIVDFNRPWSFESADFHCEPVNFGLLADLIKVHMFPPEKSATVEAFLLEPYHTDVVHRHNVLSPRSYRYWLPIQAIHLTTAMLEDYWFGIGSFTLATTLVAMGQGGRKYRENDVVYNPGIEGFLHQNRELKHLKAPESGIYTRGMVDIFMSDSFRKAVLVRDSALAARAAEEAVKAASAEREAIHLASSASGIDKGSDKHRKKKLDPRPIPPEPIRLQHRLIWNCEGLLTLQLGLIPKRRIIPKTAAEFAAAAVGPHIMTLNEELARVYAFIATVCPNLRTVEFYHPEMHFGGQGAITQDEALSQLDEEDRFHPLKQLTRLKKLETLTLRLHTIQGHIEFEDFEWMMETATEGGSSSDTAKVTSWPKLESLQIRYHTSTKDENYQYCMSLVQELRPGLDVRVRQDLLIPEYIYR